MRSLVEQHVDLVNNYKRVLGPFQRRGCFAAQVFYKVAKPSSVPDYKFEFQLDPAGVGSCYHTTGALGIVNRGAEATGYRKKRLPWWSMWAAAAGVAAAIGVACFLIPKALSAGLSSMVTSTSKGFNKALGTEIKAPSRRGDETILPEEMPRPQSSRSLSNAAQAVSAKPRVTVTGYVARGTLATVFISDGRVAHRVRPSRNKSPLRDHSWGRKNLSR